MAKYDTPVFQRHHVIEQDAYERNKLLQKLEARNLFALHGDRNLLNLPADKQLALRLEVAPHNGGPLGEYSEGLRLALKDLSDSSDGQAFLQGNDLEAGKRIGARVNNLCDTLKVAMVNGDLLTNTPEGMTPEAANARNAALFKNLPEYQRTHALQIEAVSQLAGPEARWPAVLKSEPHLTASLDAIDQPGRKTIKGNAARGLQGLSDAVDSAQESGRLTLTEQGAVTAERAFRVPRNQRGFISPELLHGDLSINQAARTLGTLAIGIDGYQTARQANQFLSEDNVTAANAQWAEFGVRTTVNVSGGAAAMAAGVAGAGPWTLVALDLVLLDKAVDKGIAHWQNAQIVSQVDKEGVEWERKGKYWIRDDLRADLQDDGRHVPVPQKFSATIEKERELNFKGSNQAVEQALGKVPTPRNPLVQPVSDDDPAHFHTMRWTYSVEREQWSRQVADSADANGAPEWNAAPEYASPERAAQLNAQALQVIDENLRAGRAAIAMQYQFGYKAYGYSHEGDVPMSVTSAMSTDRLQAWDDRYYERSTQGTWRYGNESASPERALELDLTRERLLSAMQGFEVEMAKIPEWKPPTPEQVDRAEFRRLYINKGINPDVRPEEFEAAYEAVNRTRAEHGFEPGGTKFALDEATAGRTIAEIEIKHTQMVADKEAGVVAVTMPSDIALVMRERQSLGQQEGTAQQNSPEQKITHVSPQQRDAREQAQREANRQGLSRDEALQAVQAAAANVPARGMTPGGVVAREVEAPRVEETSQAQRGQASDAPTPQAAAQMAAIEAMMTGPRDPDTLYPGHRNDQVALLQYRLDKQGYRGMEGQPLPQNGHYDLDTVSAVARFQHERGMLATGIADQQTQYEIAHAQPVRVQATDDAVRQVSPPTQQTPQPEAPRHDSERTSTPGHETAQPARVAAPAMSLGGASSSQPERERLERERETREEAPRRGTSHEEHPASLPPVHAEHAHRTATAPRDEDRDKERPFDLRHPDHPEHAMYLNAREKVASLYERHGIPMSEDKLERTTAAVLSDARAERMTKIATVEFTATEKYGNVPNVDGKLVAWSHDPAEKVPWSKASRTDTQTIDQRDPDRDYARFREETIKEEKSLAEFYKLQEEINKNPTGPMMKMGGRSLQPAGGPDGASDGGGGGDGGG